MTKKELERRYKYALLQLKIINELTIIDGLSHDEICHNIGAISYHSDSFIIKDNLQFIESYNEQYNFFNKLMNVDDYIN